MCVMAIAVLGLKVIGHGQISEVKFKGQNAHFHCRIRLGGMQRYGGGLGSQIEMQSVAPQSSVKCRFLIIFNIQISFVISRL